MPRGGKRPGAGRKHELDASQRKVIRREYRALMQVSAAAAAYNRDPIVKKNQAVDKKIAQKLNLHHGLLSDDEMETVDLQSLYNKIPAQDLPRLVADRKAAGEPDLTALKFNKRPWGPRKLFIKELAEKHGVSERMVKSCLDE